MKLIYTILLFTCVNANATKYYVAKAGNDVDNGLTTATAWGTTAKINSFTFAKHDSILINKGDTLYGSITVSQDSLYYGSYGTGANPVITGFTSIGSWYTPTINPNIWESIGAISTLSSCNSVAVNGVNTAMGRTPNTGYSTVTHHVGSTALIDTTLTGTPNWTGAEVVTRIARFAIERDTVSSQSIDTLKANYSATPVDGYGYFIQNDSLTLDTTNEWYYNPSTKKFRIYNTVSPTGVKISTIDTLVTINGHNNITIDGIDFTGSNKLTISNKGSFNTVENSNINFSGLAAIYSTSSSPNFTVNNCTILNSNDAGITSDTAWNFTCTNNTIKNTGVFAGMGSRLYANTITWLTTSSVKIGIRSYGAYANISNNEIDSSGYHGIFFYGDSVLVQNNYINTYCFVMDDGGGIYSYSEALTRVWKKRNILGNIVLNGIGANAGAWASPGYTNQAMGIYCDASNSDYNILNNTIYNNHAGIFLNNATNVDIESNTLYNNQKNISVSNYNAAIPMVNITFKKNTFVEYPDTVISFPNDVENIYWLLLPDSVVGTSLPASFVADSNYYYNSTAFFEVVQNYIGTGRTLSQWQSYTVQETHSVLAPAYLVKTVTPSFYYNPTKLDSSINFSGTHGDINGGIFWNKFLLSPYQSKVLFNSNLNVTGQSYIIIYKQP